MYEITIKRTAIQQVPATQHYERISDKGGKDGGVEYGYVTKPAHEKTVDEVAYQQRVETLNILDVVAAINGIKLP